MVFYEFNYKSFPNIKVIFNGNVNNEDLDELFKEWLNIYKRKTNFNIIFDITKIKSPTVYFAYKMANFINILRQQTPQYYKNSYIIAPNSKMLKVLLNLTFSISKPVSNVYIYWKEKNENVTVNNIMHIYHTNLFKFNFISK
jgi:hypothetical protein